MSSPSLTLRVSSVIAIGRGAVFRTVLLKVSGWNLLRAAASEKLRTLVREQLSKLLGAVWFGPFGPACFVSLAPTIRRTRSQTPPNAFPFPLTRHPTVVSNPTALAS